MPRTVKAAAACRSLNQNLLARLQATAYLQNCQVPNLPPCSSSQVSRAWSPWCVCVCACVRAELTCGMQTAAASRLS